MASKWVGWVRDLWGAKPWCWRKAILGHCGSAVFATEMVCLDALNKMYLQGDSNGCARYSKVALPEGVLPEGKPKDGE